MKDRWRRETGGKAPGRRRKGEHVSDMGRRIILAVAVAVMGMTAVDCEQPFRPLPYMAKSVEAPAILTCHDGVGHVAGNKPWILGGTCCCTPTPANYALHVQQGTIDKSMTYDQYLALYKARGIVTDLDHTGCGNLCPQGPHVVFGGHCMATPSPAGRGLYELITYGPHKPLVAAGPADAP